MDQQVNLFAVIGQKQVAIELLQGRIAELETENASLKGKALEAALKEQEAADKKKAEKQ